VELTTLRDPMLRIPEDILPLQYTYLHSAHVDTFAFTLPWEQTECTSYFANIPAREGLNEDWLLFERKS